MLFKCFFLFLVLMVVLFSGADPLWQFGKGSSKKHFCEIILKSAYWPWRRCCLTVVFFSFFFLLWWPFCSAEQNHFSNFGRGSSKEHFCEIILKSTHWPWRRGRLKGFSIFSSDGHSVQQSGTILAILVEGHPRTICVKLFLKSAHWPRRRCLKFFFPIFHSDSHFVQPCRDILAILVQGHPRNICMKLF